MISAEQLLARANAALAGGASSPVRAGHRVGGTPFFMTRGSGALAFDHSGRPYIDYIMGYGPLLFGFRQPGAAQIARALSDGTLFGSTHEAEIALAERILAHLPSMERIRFASTGTEAVMGAVRVARAHTGRTTLMRFSGNYHGHSDFALLDAGASAETAAASRSGIPHSVRDESVVLLYNDSDAVRAWLAAHPGQLAAIIVEPIVGNMGLVEAAPGFLENLLELAHADGAVVIFDEVITWLRFGLGGAQAKLKLRPDMTTFGKILGGGIPIAGFGGRREIMAALAPTGSVFTGGTHAGNPIGVIAAHAVLDELEHQPSTYTELNRKAARLAAGLQQIIRDHSLPCYVLQRESVVDLKFRPGAPIRNYAEAAEADGKAFARFYHAMRDRGIILAPSWNEVMFISTEHTDAQIDQTLTAAQTALPLAFTST